MNRLKSPYALVLGMASILAFNIRHMIQAYEGITGSNNFWWDLAALIALDVTIFLFALHGKRWISFGFAVVVAIINITHLTTGDAVTEWYEYLVAACFGLAYSVGIWVFSDLFVTVGEAGAARRYTEAERQSYAAEYSASWADMLDQAQQARALAERQVEAVQQLLVRVANPVATEREYNRLRVTSYRRQLDVDELEAYQAVQTLRVQLRDGAQSVQEQEAEAA